jgi:hypothetical protein
VADLTNTVRWVPYVPDLLGNRDLESPFYFELNGSLSKEQLRAIDAELSKAVPEPEELPADATDEQQAAREEQIRVSLVKARAAALSAFIKLGAEPLTIAGKRIETLEQYLDFVLVNIRGVDAFVEPMTALIDANRLSGRSTFFLGRLSGGFVSTISRRNGKAGSQTVAR